MKKIISFVTVLTVAAMIAGPANGATAEELQAQITNLLAQLNALQAQLSALGGTTVGVPAACAGITAFNTNLTVGSTGNDVKCLQALLNTSADTQVAASGVGSAGNETTYFGPLTRAGVSKYQVKKGITPTAGYFGPITRASINPMLTAGTTTTTTTTTTTETATTCESATEGSFTVVLSGTPTGRTISAGAGIEAYGIDVSAINSDINIGRVDLQVAVVNATTAVPENPANFISAIKVYDTSVSDANLKKTYTSPVFTQDTAARWYTQLVDINFSVPKGTSKKLLIVIDTGTGIDQNRTVTLNVYGNGLRGRDCKGIDSYVALATTRVLTVQTPGTAVLTVTAGADMPTTNLIKSDATNGVQTKETILSLNAKATGGSGKLLRLEVSTLSAAGASIASTAVPSILYLYDGDTLVGTATPPTAAAAGTPAAGSDFVTFENFGGLPIAQDETKNLKVKASWNTTDSGQRLIVLNTPASTPANAAGGAFERANGQQVGVTTTAQITSNPQFISEQGVKFTFVSGVGTYTPEGTTAGIGTAKGVLTLKVKPFGGSLDMPLTLGCAATGVADGMIVDVEAQSLLVASGVASGNWEFYASTGAFVLTRDVVTNPASQDISEDQEATVTVTMSLGTPDGFGSLAGNMRFKIKDVCWSVGAVRRCNGESAGATWGLTGNMVDNWFTNTVYLVP